MVELIQILSEQDKENTQKMFIDNSINECKIGLFNFQMEIKEITQEMKIITFQVKYSDKDIIIGIFNFNLDFYNIMIRSHIKLMISYYEEAKLYKIKHTYMMSLYEQNSKLPNCFGSYKEDSELCKDGCDSMNHCMIVCEKKQ